MAEQEKNGIVQIEPGDRIPVDYGRGKTVVAKALSGRGKRRLISVLEEIGQVKEEGSNLGRLFDLAEAAFKICVPDASEELLESMDERQQIEIAGKVMATSFLTEEQRKKLESPH